MTAGLMLAMHFGQECCGGPEMTTSLVLRHRRTPLVRSLARSRGDLRRALWFVVALAAMLTAVVEIALLSERDR
jgi:hypothetical protein